MNNFLLIDENEIKLNSGLNEYMFGKTSYSSVVNQTGVIYDGEKFEDWTFSDIKSISIEDKDDPQVFYVGKNPLSGNAVTLLDHFEGGDRNAVFMSAMAVCTALTKAAKENISLPINGAGGIIVDLPSDPAAPAPVKLLFLPSDLYKYTLAGLPERDQANARGCWINESLSGLPALSFFRATIAYTMLTGEYPFPSTNTVERNADILDKKFLPIEMALPNVAPNLAAEINKGLKLTSSIVNQPGKKTKGKSSDDLTPNADFPLELLEKERNNVPSEELKKELKEKAQNYIKKRDSKIKTKRMLRRNTTLVAFIFLAIIALAFIIRGSIRSKLTNFTTQGLTSTQTINGFIQCINKQNAPMLIYFTKGKSASRYTDTVSQVYVLSKQRQQYGNDQGFTSPERYFIFVTDPSKNMNAGLYGVTHVKIDGVEQELTTNIPLNKDNLPPVTQENGQMLVKGITTQHTVEYYLLHTEGENSDIYVSEVTEIYTLYYDGQKWLITDIDTQSKDIPLDSESFKTEYFKYLMNNNYDVEKAMDDLSFTYPWLPTKESVIREKESILAIAQDPFAGL